MIRRGSCCPPVALHMGLPAGRLDRQVSNISVVVSWQLEVSHQRTRGTGSNEDWIGGWYGQDGVVHSHDSQGLKWS